MMTVLLLITKTFLVAVVQPETHAKERKQNRPKKKTFFPNIYAIDIQSQYIQINLNIFVDKILFLYVNFQITPAMIS